MLDTTKAIVLSKIKYKDYDLIVTCFTKQFGIKSYLIKGVLKSKKGKFKAAHFQPLSLLSIEAEHKTNRTLHYLKDIEVKHLYTSLHSNVVKSSIVMFIAEVLTKVLIEEEQNEALYNFIETALIWFDETENYTNFHLTFLIELTKYLGFYPKIDDNDKPYFNLESGNFEITKNGNFSIFGKQLIILKELLGTKFDENIKLDISLNEKREIITMILLYFKLHLENFKTPKSLTVLNQVYQ